MAEVAELSSANRIRQLAGMPIEPEAQTTLRPEEPPAWNEIKESEDYKTLAYPEQVNLARQWGAETKQYASTLPDYTPEQDAEIDDYVNTQAVDVPASVQAAAGTAGFIKGAAQLAGGLGAGLVGSVAGPVGAIAAGVGGSIAAGEMAEAGLQRFVPNVARAREFAPGTATAAEYAPSVVMGTVGAAQLVQAGKTLFAELGAKRAAQELGKTIGVAGGVGAGVGTGVRAVTGGEISPATIAADALFGATFAGLGSGTRIKGYNREQALSLNERVKAGTATEAEFRDWNGILAEAQRTQARDVAGARRTEVELGGRRVLDKTELTLGEQPQVRPQPTAELPLVSPIPAVELAEAGVRGSVRGTQADTAAMQRRGIITPMQESLVDLNDPVPRKNVFTTESQGINREAIIPDIRGLQGEIVSEGPLVTPRTQLPTTERLALPAGEQPVIEARATQAVEPVKQVEIGKSKIVDLYEKYDLAEENLTEADVAYSLRNILDESDVPGTNKLNEILGKYEEAQQVDQFEFGKRSGEPEFYADQLMSELGKFSAKQKPQPTMPRPMRGKPGEAGFIVSDVQEGAAKVAQKYLTTEGNLPKEMFDIMEAKGSRTQAMLKQIEFTLKDLGSAAKALNKGKAVLTPKQSSGLDQYLRGIAPISNLPELFQPIAAQMRRQLDNLSERLIQTGAFSQEIGASGKSKADIIRANKGEYLTRSYEKFDSPRFSVELLKKRSPQQFVIAENFVRGELKSQNPNITEEEVQGRIKEIVEGGRDKPMESLVQSASIGKRLGITKARQDIPEQIRYLMGEYNDPVINYARSASKMINLLQSQEQLNKLREIGLANKLFFDKPTGNAATQIAAEGSDTRSPLNGLYAEKDLVDAIENFEISYKGGDVFQLYSIANAWVKWGKTVGSVQAQFRNPMSNVLIEVANGNLFFVGKKEATKAILAEFGVPQMDTKEGRAYLVRATQLGVYDNTVLNEFTQMLKDAQQYQGTTLDFAEKLAGQAGNVAKRTGAAGIATLNKTYRAGDNFFKLMAWENETKQLMDGRGLSRQEAEVIGAERVKNTRPTYSRVPRIVKAFRLQPFIGNFVSWPSEIMRTVPNSVRYAAEDMVTPGMRKYGLARIMGMLAATTALIAVGRLAMWATGFNDRKMDALRRFVAPYQKNAQLMPTGMDGRDIGYTDLSYTSPYEIFTAPVLAAASGRDPEESIFGAIKEFTESYVGPSILANSIASAYYGKTPQGRTIRNPQDTFTDQSVDTISYILRQNEPATVSQVRRIIYALSGQPDTAVSRYGRVYRPSEELSALFGVRPQSINISKALESKASRFGSNMADVGRIFTETYGAVGNVPEAKVREQFAKMDNRRRVMFDEANRDYHAAMLLGLSRSEAISSMRAGGMGTDNASAVANNKYRDYKISKSLTRQLRKELAPEEMQKRIEIGRELMMRQEE